MLLHLRAVLLEDEWGSQGRTQQAIAVANKFGKKTISVQYASSKRLPT